jgi:hypothetical protein
MCPAAEVFGLAKSAVVVEWQMEKRAHQYNIVAPETVDERFQR